MSQTQSRVATSAANSAGKNKSTTSSCSSSKKSSSASMASNKFAPLAVLKDTITTPPEHPPHYIPAFNYSQESLENQGEPADIPNSWKFPGQLPGMQPIVPILQVHGPNSLTFAATAAQGVPTSSKQVFRNPHKDRMAEEAKKWEIIKADWDAWNDASSNFLKNEVEGRNATFMAVYKIAKQPRLDWGDGPDTNHHHPS
ncbi:hypothetical protein AMATHDRAFT_9062 [Amanita thiersii Skay4041]|uniref:Uncharacterized protein n=1 Tax=Amanita thiersii Skay4041 TaxID=703135 RepID=A0A2A9NB93_9AGAR|nr:hypothetical protein AMATHDRAFT_9062 [Amanita thiersii Skay4041]